LSEKVIIATESQMQLKVVVNDENKL